MSPVMICRHCGKEYQKRHGASVRELAVSKYCSMPCQRAARIRPAADRFWEKVNKTDGCWEWTASRLRFGHGLFYRDPKKRTFKATHFSWELHYGPVPKGLWVLHKCDNPPRCKPNSAKPRGGEVCGIG